MSTVFVGYPRGIVREKAGKTTGTWSYWKLMTRIATTLENYGIAVFGVPEDGTSRVCARHGCEVRRKPRGLVKCLHNHVIHADVNAALNILARGASLLGCEVEVPERIKVYSFIPTPSGVKPRNNPAPRAG